MPDIKAEDVKLVSAFQLDPAGNVKSGWGESRPVFLVTFRDDSKIVLKAELKVQGEKLKGAMTQKSAEFSGSLMGKVSPQIGAAGLKDGEAKELRNLALIQFCNGQIGKRTQEYLNDLLGAGIFVFFKQPFVANLRSMEGMIKKNKGVKVLRKLREDKSILVELGKIVAVDLFIGNKDRFTSDGAIKNDGNVIFQKNENKTYTPVGLDFFEAQGDATNMFTPPPADWPGLMLGDPVRDHYQQIYRFAKNAVDSLNEAFGNTLAGQISKEDLLPNSAVGSFVNGMQQGRDALKDHLVTVNTRTVQRLPSGATERMRLLNWI